MNLRGTNFISQIFHISVVEETIKGLFGDDRYYFHVNVNSKSRVYYIQVDEFADGEVFKLYRDNTKYIGTDTSLASNYNAKKEDELIKIIKSTETPVVIGTEFGMDSDRNPIEKPVYADPKIVSQSETPAESMAKYTLVYIDALQTI